MTSDHSSNNKAASKSGGGCGGGVPGIFLAIICLVLEAIVFIFCLIGTPIDCFKAKVATAPRSCYSMWGSKRCGPHRANPAGAMYKGFPTSGIRTTMDAAAAFAIISIFVTLVALVLTVLLVCKCIFRVIPGIFSIIAFFTLLLVWACQAGVYHRRYTVAVIGTIELRGRISANYDLAGSFGLFVTAWCLQTIEMVLVFFA